MHTNTTHYWLADAARILRVHPKTLRRAVARGEVPHIRVGPWIKIDVRYLGMTPPLRAPVEKPGGYGVLDEPLFEMRPLAVRRTR